ncbi:MAG: hypothetical protein CL610_00485 [Anaerolineaceae bacterium]|nr:hypothetical protein [Anaerolineaceae bacterium]
MIRLNRNLILSLLALLTTLVLLLRLPQFRPEYAGAALLCGALTFAAQYYGVRLTRGWVSTAYVVGLMAVVMLPAESHSTLLWGIATGAVAGALAIIGYPQQQPGRQYPASNAQIFMMAAATILSFGIISSLYPQATEQLGQLILFAAAYPLIGLLIYLLALYVDGLPVWETVSDNRILLLLVFVAPLPLVLFLARLDAGTPNVYYGLIVAVMVPLVPGLHGFSRMHNDRMQRIREMRVIANVSRAMRANQDIEKLLQAVYQELGEVVPIDHFTAMLYEPDSKHLHGIVAIRQGQQIPVSDPQRHQPNTVIDQVLRTQSPLLLSANATQDAQRRGLTPPDYPAWCWLGVPLLVGGRVLGVLEIASVDPAQRYGESEQRVLHIIASAVSAAIDNAQLYKQQTERAVRLSNLNMVLMLLTETLSPDDVLDTVISSASAVSDATAIAVYRYETEDFTLVRCAGLSESFDANPILNVQDQDRLGSAAQPVVIENAATDHRVSKQHPAWLAERKQAWIELPLAVSGQTIGAIILYFDSPQFFSGEEIELLRTFANQAAQAIRNADLYAGTYRALENRIEQLSVLAALARHLMATTDLEMISNLLLQSAVAATNTKAGVVLLRDRYNGHMHLMARHGYPANTLNGHPFTEGITGRVLSSGQAIHSSQSDPAYISLVEGNNVQLSIPINWQGDTLGAITLENNQPYTDEQHDFVERLVNQAVFAIENAHLFHNAAEGRDRMQAILNTMTDGLILINRRAYIALANPRVDLLGLESDVLISQNLSDLLANPDLRLAERLGFETDSELLRVVNTLRAPVVRADTCAYNLTTETNARYIRRQMIPVRDEQADVIGLLLVFSDETERHNLERAREEFSQMIIHDLRSPLTAITSSVELLSEIMPPENEFSALVQKTAGSSKRAIRKLLNRVDSLLDISRMKSGIMSLHLEVSVLGPLAENVCSELEPLANDLGVHITAHIPDDLPQTVMDVEKIERVLLNLVDNALKFSPRESEIRIHAVLQEKVLRVEVIDQGPGVPEAERLSIFDRFVQIQNQSGRLRRGSGLGLNFCKLAVEAHNGRIWIDDNPAGGSIFIFTLPVSDSDHTLQISS